MPGYDMSKEDLLARLRRIEGRVRGADRKLTEATTAVERLLKS